MFHKFNSIIFHFRSFLGIVFSLSLIFGMSTSLIHGQSYEFCDNSSISQMAWSPNGQQLAVLTQQGIHFFDRELELFRSIPAPMVGYYRPSISISWSPDSEWILIPQPPSEYLSYGGGSNLWSIINSQSGEIDAIDPMGRSGTPVWSPDNRFIALLGYIDPLGLASAYSQLTIRSGISETLIQPRSRKFYDIHLTDLQWRTDDIISARVDGLVLSFDIQTLQPTADDPYFYPSWWVSNPDRMREAGFAPDTIFYIKDAVFGEQSISVSPYLLSDGSFYTIGLPENIYWMLDNRHLIAVYPRRFPYATNSPSDISRTLQGTVIDTYTANEVNHFLIVTDTDIVGYSVSSIGDRIAIFRDRTRLELWNPLTNELVVSEDVPSIEFDTYCD